MKEQQDYSQDIAEIRSMMERSSKFLSLSGWAGIMAGIYALAGAWVAWTIYGFNPDGIAWTPIEPGNAPDYLPELIILGLGVLVLALATAIYLSWKKADGRGERIWNVSSRRLLASVAVPMVAGGVLVLILLSEGLIGLVAPVMLLFYGLALYNASHFTISELKVYGLLLVVLGLAGAWFVEYGLLVWAIGFGAGHIIYGILIHIRHER